MATSINWGTRVISVLQADLTHISGDLYELDTAAFRLELKDLEDSEDGMPFPDTHIHNVPVTVAGVTYSRTIEIINGYSITFEDTGSPYTVRLVGSNNNIFDVENGILNPTDGVTVVSSNSGGLIVTDSSGITPQIESDVADLRKAAFNRVHTDPSTGVMTIYDDDDATPLKSGDIYEDTGASQAYRGQGLERRNKLT